MAVIFVTKVENGEKKTKGLCIKCAKEMGVPIDNFVGNLMNQFGISSEQPSWAACTFLYGKKEIVLSIS